MGIRLVRGAGHYGEPVVVNMPASGTIHRDGLVIFDAVANMVSASIAGTGNTTTNIVGVALDGVQGASDAYVRVIPFMPGQIWEVDCANVAATSNLFVRSQMKTDLVVINQTGGTAIGTSETMSTGIFLPFAMTGAATGSGKLLGTFLQRVSILGKDGVTPTT